MVKSQNKMYLIKKSNYLIIDELVLRSISLHAQYSGNCKEQGGVLIGQYRGEHIAIVNNTTPQKEDVASRFRFERKSVKHKELVINEWIKSNKESTYLGEWHTHPEDYPSPSTIDISHWNKELPKNKTLILIIQGRKSIWVGSYINGKALTLNTLN